MSTESARAIFAKEKRRLSPDKSREFQFLENPEGGWVLILSNLGYFTPSDQEGPFQRRTVLSLCVELKPGIPDQISIGLEATTSPKDRSADNFRYPPNGQKTRGSGNLTLGALVPQLNKGLMTGNSLPQQIDVLATAALFVQQAMDGNFGNPVLVRPDGSLFQAPLPAAE